MQKKLFSIMTLALSAALMAGNAGLTLNASASAESVVDIFMDNYSTWQENATYSAAGCGVLFLDVDFDGELELVTTSMAGSGFNTSVEIYKIENGKVVSLDTETPQEFIDILWEKLGPIRLLSDENGVKEYYAPDHIRGGMFYEEDVYSSFAYHPEENVVARTDYYGAITERALNNANDVTYSWMDYQKNANITEDEYNQLKSNIENLTDLNVTYKIVDIRNLSDSDIRQSLLDSYQAFSYTGFSSEPGGEVDTGLSEEELKAKVEELGTVTVWQYADFDGDGKKEAFAVLTEEESDETLSIKEVYFINADGEITLMPEDAELTYLSYYPDSETYLECQGKGFFSVDMGGFGSGYHTLLYSVKDGKPYQLSISKDLQGFYQDAATGKFYTVQGELVPGVGHAYPTYELVYDEETQEFSIGDEIEISETETTTTTTTTETKTTTTTTKTTTTTAKTTSTTKTTTSKETTTTTKNNTSFNNNSNSSGSSNTYSYSNSGSSSSNSSSTANSSGSPATGDNLPAIFAVAASALGAMEFFRKPKNRK